VEADGGSRGNPGPAAYGALILQSGVPIRQLAGAIGRATNNVAEYRSVLAALEWIATQPDAAGAVVDVRMDSKLVVEQMSGRWKIKHPDMRALALQVRDALPAHQVHYTWVPRERNRRADALVNEVLDAGEPGLVIDRAP
jgi:probable phosphoglycerate mutase